MCVSLESIAAKALNLFQIIVQYVNIVSAKVDFDQGQQNKIRTSFLYAVAQLLLFNFI